MTDSKHFKRKESKFCDITHSKRKNRNKLFLICVEMKMHDENLNYQTLLLNNEGQIICIKIGGKTITNYWYNCFSSGQNTSFEINTLL